MAVIRARRSMSEQRTETPAADTPRDQLPGASVPEVHSQRPQEVGGPKGPEPTRYGDWEKNGRCIDF
ncbi:MAG TPA: DUF1674 domain-containing protein [Gammaproteobacteria bacterium]|nr:DUF1674 domain-containing protein [Gammaproteobacteria bacterium]